MEKYEIVKTTGEFKYRNRYDVKLGCTIDTDTSPETIQTFETETEALKALKTFSTSIRELGDYFEVEEYHVEKKYV